MFLSVFDMFKVGIGPSSSHTMGPMVAAARFLETLRASPFHFHGLRASLHGSLAFTGVGHATDRATILGLAGFAPDTYDAEKAEAVLARIKETHVIEAPGLGTLSFDPGRDLTFDYGPALPGHANGMVLKATDAQGDVILQETYYSIGGGFVLTASELAEAGGTKAKARADVPYPFETAAEMLEMAQASGNGTARLPGRVAARERIRDWVSDGVIMGVPPGPSCIVSLRSDSLCRALQSTQYQAISSP